MKIAHLTLTFLPVVGGAQFAVHNLASHQQQTQSVTVVTSWKSYRATRRGTAYRVIPLLPGSQWLAWRCAGSPVIRWLLITQLRLLQWWLKFDVWHIHYAYPSGYLALRGLSATRLVLTCHGADIQDRDHDPEDPYTSPKIRQAVSDTVPAFPALIALSESLRSRYTALGAIAGRISLIPNGLDLDRFAPMSTSQRRATLRHYAVPPDHRILLTIGRHAPVKGYSSIPRIARYLKDMGITFTWFLVAGHDPAFEDEIRRQGLEASIRVLDTIAPAGASDMQDGLPPAGIVALYDAADVLVATSRMESFGCVVAEAMAAGLPVVATDAPGHRDIVSDGVTGFLVPLDQPEPMAARIADILRNGQRARDMSQRARAAVKPLDWKQVAEQTVSLYQGIGL